MKIKGRAKSTNIEDKRFYFGSQALRTPKQRESDIKSFLYESLFGPYVNRTGTKTDYNTLKKQTIESIINGN